MEPAIPVGSVLIVERVRDPDKLSVGDVVTYQRPGMSFTITHRIIEVTERGFIMKGDNLMISDGEIIGEWVRYRAIACYVEGALSWSGNGVKGQYAGVTSSKRP